MKNSQKQLQKFQICKYNLQITKEEMFVFKNFLTELDLMEDNDSLCYFVENHSFEPETVISWLKEYITNDEDNNLPFEQVEFPKQFFDLTDTTSILNRYY